MKNIVVILVLLFVSMNAYAQQNNVNQKPNFSGIWLLNKEKSTFFDHFKPTFENLSLEIDHREPSFSVKMSTIYKAGRKDISLILYTDQRGETALPFTEKVSSEVESKTSWKNNLLVRKFTVKAKTEDGTSRTNTIEKYELSKNGKKLTVHKSSLTNAPMPLGAGVGTFKIREQLVFVKQE